MKKTSLLLSLLFSALMMMGQISVELISYANMPVCDGVIEVFAEGTAGPFEVEVVQYGQVVKLKTPIPNGANSILIEGLCDGKHQVNVINSFGCNTPLNISVGRCEFKITNEPNIQRRPTGCGATDGEIRFFSDAGLEGGTGPYTYTWTNREGEVIPPVFGQNLHINNLGSSIYTLTIEDVNGCKATAEYDLLSENEPDAYGEPTASCEGEDNGRVNLVASMPNNGGAVNFFWSTGVVLENTFIGTIEGLSPGTYSVTISDPQGICSIERSYEVEERASTGPFTYTSSIGLSCASRNNGSIDLQATGGNPPYEYRWDTWRVFGSSRSDLAGGIYCVTITDDCDREIRECFDIALPEPEIEIVPTIGCDGSGALTVNQVKKEAPAVTHFLDDMEDDIMIYIEKISESKSVLWFEDEFSSWSQTIETPSNLKISHLSKKNQSIYLGGTFEESLSYEEQRLYYNRNFSGFLLEINHEGELLNQQIVENINPTTDFLIGDGLQGIILSGESQESAINVNGQFQEVQDGGIFNVKVASGSVTTNSEIRTQGSIKTKKVIQTLEDTRKTYLFKGEGSIAVGGINYTTISRDAALIKVNANGSRKWFKRFRSTNGGEIKSIDIASGDDESVYVGLTFTGGLISNRVRFESKGGEDILIFKLDDRGNVIDYKQYGTIEDERIMELLYDSGTLYFGGEFSGQESDRLIGRIKYVNHSNTYNNAYVSYLFDTDFDKGATERSEDTDSIKELEKAMIAMPNPFSDKVTIEVNDETIVQLAIYNTLGEEVASSSVTTGRAWKVDFSNIPKGLYILQATDEKGRTVVVESIVHQ